MQPTPRIERALIDAIASCDGAGAPPRLIAALRHAVLSGGARVRPKLCLAVAAACGDPDPGFTDAAAVSIELMHCASLVHDDLPCFDDAPLRRGLPSVHAAFGERLAVLAGDALVVLAFAVLGRGAVRQPQVLPAMMQALSARVGTPTGVIGGQAWECEDWVALPDYQRAKTGSLFAAATEMGAMSAGDDPLRWRALGECLGEAYQVADDIRDVAGDVELLGKPAARDMALGRPNAVGEMGMAGALAYFDDLVWRAAESVPAGPGAAALKALMVSEGERLLPPKLRQQVTPLAA